MHACAAAVRGECSVGAHSQCGLGDWPRCDGTGTPRRWAEPGARGHPTVSHRRHPAASGLQCGSAGRRPATLKRLDRMDGRGERRIRRSVRIRQCSTRVVTGGAMGGSVDAVACGSRGVARTRMCDGAVGRRAVRCGGDCRRRSVAPLGGIRGRADGLWHVERQQRMLSLSRSLCIVLVPTVPPCQLRTPRDDSLERIQPCAHAHAHAHASQFMTAGTSAAHITAGRLMSGARLGTRHTAPRHTECPGTPVRHDSRDARRMLEGHSRAAPGFVMALSALAPVLTSS